MSGTYVIGDVHGDYSKLVRLLKDVGLVDSALHWSGNQAVLLFTGDFFDR